MLCLGGVAWAKPSGGNQGPTRVTPARPEEAGQARTPAPLPVVAAALPAAPAPAPRAAVEDTKPSRGGTIVRATGTGFVAVLLIVLTVLLV
jgi:hypothetical protein